MEAEAAKQSLIGLLRQTSDTVTLLINGEPMQWEVVGVVQEIGAPRRGLGIPASAYVNLDAFNDLIGRTGTTNAVRIKTEQRNAAFLNDVQPSIDEALASAGISVKDLQARATRRFILENHLVVIIGFLMMMAVLINVTTRTTTYVDPSHHTLMAHYLLSLNIMKQTHCVSLSIKLCKL